MAPPVARVGHELGGRDIGVADDPVAPGGVRRHLRPEALHRGANRVSDVVRVARLATAHERTSDMAELRQCIGSTRFGIEAHEAPVEDFPVQSSQKGGLGRMCKVH
jgi:hypothetical protein